MNRLTALLILLLVCSWSQTVRAQAADSWVDISPEDEQFTIKMPPSRPVKSQQNSFDQLKVEARIYTATSEGVEYAVWSLTNDDQVRTASLDNDAYLDACAELVWESLLKPLRDQVPKSPQFESYMSYQGELSKVVPGREYAITLGNRPGLTRIYVAGKQIYVLTVLNAEANSAGTQRFINSFGLKVPGLPVATTLQEDPTLILPPGRVAIGTGVGPGRGENPSAQNAGAGAALQTPIVVPPSAGVGAGAGLGPGRGGNIGGGDRNVVGGAPATGANASTDYNRVFTGREVTAKARVLAKPEPQYTESARKFSVQGTVVIRGVFSSSGEVTSLKALSRLPHGLTERALSAAKQIRFTPALKDGRAVSMYIQLEYNFNLY